MHLIAGLGNPEDRYDGTRHNTGFEVIDRLARMYDIPMDFMKHKSVCGKGIIEGEKIMLMKPVTYMNRSGEAISDAIDFYKLFPSSELIVVYDDVDLPVGKIRIRESGSAGGHNGMKDIVERLGEKFVRVRVGVGEKPAEWDLADWVLSRFGEEDEKIMKDARIKAAEAVSDILSHDVEYAMSHYNGS